MAISMGPGRRETILIKTNWETFSLPPAVVLGPGRGVGLESRCRTDLGIAGSACPRRPHL